MIIKGPFAWKRATVSCGNDRVGNRSHLGLATTYSNVGTLLIPVGLKVFPLKGHELTGWYAYRGMVNSRLVEIAFFRKFLGKC